MTLGRGGVERASRECSPVSRITSANSARWGTLSLLRNGETRTVAASRPRSPASGALTPRPAIRASWLDQNAGSLVGHGHRGDFSLLKDDVDDPSCDIVDGGLRCRPLGTLHLIERSGVAVGYYFPDSGLARGVAADEGVEVRDNRVTPHPIALLGNYSGIGIAFAVAPPQ